MIRSTLSIMGLYQFNPEIFDGLRVPTEMSRDNVITEILAQCAELELVYPSYNTMKLLIKTWTDAELHLWERAYIDSTVKYNPIWNVDGTETETIERALSGRTTDENERVLSGETTNGSERTLSGTNTNENERILSGASSGEHESEGTTENSRVGYNNIDWTRNEKTDMTESSSESGTIDETETNSGTGTTTQNEKNSETGTVDQNETNSGIGTKDETETITTIKTRGGNIGVTKTQDMLMEDWALLPTLNAYQFIVDSFKRRFCLLVY